MGNRSVMTNPLSYGAKGGPDKNDRIEIVCGTCREPFECYNRSTCARRGICSSCLKLEHGDSGRKRERTR